METKDTKKVVEEKLNFEIEKDLLSRKISVMLASKDKIPINSELNLKNERDLKKAILDKTLKKEDRLYAQKFYLK